MGRKKKGVWIMEYCKANARCVPENRTTQCEDKTNEKFTEQSSLGMYTGYIMKRQEHLEMHAMIYLNTRKYYVTSTNPWYDKKCGICGSSHRSCCC